MGALSELQIQHACEKLMMEYCYRVDSGVASTVADLFTEDCVRIQGNNKTEGREALRAGFQMREDNKGRISRHVCHNTLLDITSETQAHGVTYLTLYRHDGEPERKFAPLERAEMVGDYCNDFVRTEGGWLIARQEIKFGFLNIGDAK
jgi:ketosteroid isomerase-like protein